MAFSGHISWQQKQEIHKWTFTCGMFLSIDNADTGHWSTQVPHPVHNPGSACGRMIIRVWSIACIASL
jgi:hypothetical protein